MVRDGTTIYIFSLVKVVKFTCLDYDIRGINGGRPLRQSSSKYAPSGAFFVSIHQFTCHQILIAWIFSLFGMHGSFGTWAAAASWEVQKPAAAQMI